MHTSQALKTTTHVHYLMHTFIMLAVMLLIPQIAHANAGMLVIAEDGGKTYLLFVQTHKHDCYEFPGGRVERGEDLVSRRYQKETVYETAVRETMEETRGYLGRQQLTSASSADRFIEAGKYSLFLAKLPFFKLDEVREIKIPRSKKWASMREVVNYAWVDVSVISKAGVATARDGQVVKLHPIAQRAVKIGRLNRWF